MPHKNTVRAYTRGGYYHIYNRGVEKRVIFKNNSDYNFFISLLESYLEPKKPIGSEERLKDTTKWRSKLEKDEVELMCFCLMPNHFHFLIKQNTKEGVTKFMRRVSNAYVKHFNKKYDRVGGLFQGKFKAVLIKNDDYLLHLSRYIHLNPLEVRPLKIGKNEWLSKYLYSSYPVYIKNRITPWIKTNDILSFFNNSRKTFLEYKSLLDYQNFVEKYKGNTRKRLGTLTLD